MKVYVVPDMVRQAVRIYVELGTLDNGHRLYATRVGESAHVEVPPEAEPPMYVEPLDMRIAEEIGKALAPRPEATERHLDDALQARDRLMGMVERIIDADLAREAAVNR